VIIDFTPERSGYLELLIEQLIIDTDISIVVLSDKTYLGFSMLATRIFGDPIWLSRVTSGTRPLQ